MAKSDESELRTCLNNIISLLALPAMWAGGDLSDIAERLTEALLDMLEADFVFLKIGATAQEGVTATHLSARDSSLQLHEIAGQLSEFMDIGSRDAPGGGRLRWRESVFQIASAPLGVTNLTGVLIAGSRHPSFPDQEQRLILNIGANHAALAAQEARNRRALEINLAHRTRELETANELLVQEIRGRQRADQRLRRSQAFLAQAQRLTLTGSIWWSLSTGEMVWSMEIFRLFEYPFDEIPTIELLAARCHPDDLGSLEAIVADLKSDGSSVDIQHRLRMGDGRVKHVHVVLQNVADVSDSEIFGAITDITERKIDEDALRQSEMLLLAGQKMSRTGTFSWRLDTDTVRGSEEWSRIFGFDGVREVSLQSIAQRVHPDDRPMLEENIREARAGKEGTEHQLRILCEDGSIKYLRSVSRIVQRNDGYVDCIGATQDITQRQLAEDDRDKLRSDLSHVTQSISLGEMAASIAHEVSQPLSGIMTNANTCLMLLSAEPPNLSIAMEAVRRTLRDSQRAADVITRVRALFKKNTIVFEAFDLNTAATEVIGLLASDFQRRRIGIRTELEASLPLVDGDRVQLQQVILNLLRNAADAIDEGGGIERKIVLRTSAMIDGFVQVAVQDTGQGIDLTSSEELFGAFRSTKPERMGVGLSMSRSIIEGHNGRIWVERRQQNSGISFCFCVPRHTPPNDNRAADPTSEQTV